MGTNFVTTWTSEQIETLKAEYPMRPARETAVLVGHTTLATRIMACKLGVSHRAKRGRGVSPGMKWTDKQIKSLKAGFPVLHNDVVAKWLKKSPTAIAAKAKELGLVKDTTPREKMAWETWLDGRRKRPGWIYLMRGRGTNSYKIGFTRKHIDQRLAAMTLHSPVIIELVGMQEGTRQAEVALHERFAKYRSHGEWFLLPDDVANKLTAEFKVTEQLGVAA